MTKKLKETSNMFKIGNSSFKVEDFKLHFLNPYSYGLINNEPVKTKAIISIKSPIDLKETWSFCGMNEDDVNKAYQSAASAFKTWSKTPFEKRKKILLNFADLLEKHKDFLAKLMINQIAKSYKDSLAEVTRTVIYIKDTIKVFEEQFIKPKIIGEKINAVKGKTGYFYREPLGVVLAISPFNYPINTPINKIAPALISGNTVIFKPATQGSIIGIEISELLIKAGIPKGVFHCIVGRGRDIGSSLYTNKNLSMISFTGGTDVGLEMLQNSKVGNISLELGGKDAAIVLSDADLNLTVKEIVKGAFNYSGQRCTAIKRVLVVKPVANKLISLLKEAVEKLTIDNPKNNPDIVPVVDESSAKYIMSLVDDAKKKGAKIICGGINEHNWIKPTLISKVTDKMKIAWEEPFGPVLPIIEVKDVKEAIELNNASQYGLQASIFTKNEAKALEISKELEVGTVNLNRSSSRGPDVFPFLGVKDSGVGVQGVTDAINSMTKYKGFIVNK